MRQCKGDTPQTNKCESSPYKQEEEGMSNEWEKIHVHDSSEVDKIAFKFVHHPKTVPL